MSLDFFVKGRKLRRNMVRSLNRSQLPGYFLMTLK